MGDKNFSRAFWKRTEGIGNLALLCCLEFDQGREHVEHETLSWDT